MSNNRDQLNCSTSNESNQSIGPRDGPLDLRILRQTASPLHSKQKKKSTKPCSFKLNASRFSGSGTTTSSCPGSNRPTNGINQHKKRKKPINQFLKHKLKYRYLQQHRKTTSGDSGAFGSSSLQGTSSTGTSSYGKQSNESVTPSLSSYTSSSPHSGSSGSPVNLTTNNMIEPRTNQQQLCMIMRQAVPIILIVQDQMQGKENGEHSESVLFRCNICQLFVSSMTEVLSHVQSSHISPEYCFICSKFFRDKAEYNHHKPTCTTAQTALQNIIDGHQMEQYGKHSSKEQPLNLSVASCVALRAAQMIHNKRGSKNKIKKLLKCTYCKKAFFGRFYLQRHLRSHTGEKLCHCSVCGKGFAEWRNLRNHMSRFHNSSETDSGGQSKSASPNNSSESDQRSMNRSRCLQQLSPATVLSMSIAENDQCDQHSVKTETSYQPDIMAGRATAANLMYTMTDTETMTAAYCEQQRQANTNSKHRFDDSCIQPMQDSSNPSCSSRVPQDYPNNISARTSTESSEANAKVTAASLGFTSSRLEIKQDEQQVEDSLQMIVGEDGKKYFQCQMCSKRFQTKFAMQRHLDFHADKRPFQCDQCDYKAKTKPQLKVHLMRHTGKKGFHCSICNYSCVTHSDLNRHCKSRSHLFRVGVLEGHKTAPNPTEQPLQINSHNNYNPSGSS